jgi:hypothetical protein
VSGAGAGSAGSFLVTTTSGRTLHVTCFDRTPPPRVFLLPAGGGVAAGDGSGRRDGGTAGSLADLVRSVARFLPARAPYRRSALKAWAALDSAARACARRRRRRRPGRVARLRAARESRAAPAGEASGRPASASGRLREAHAAAAAASAQQGRGAHDAAGDGRGRPGGGPGGAVAAAAAAADFAGRLLHASASAELLHASAGVGAGPR